MISETNTFQKLLMIQHCSPKLLSLIKEKTEMEIFNDSWDRKFTLKPGDFKEMRLNTDVILIAVWVVLC